MEDEETFLTKKQTEVLRLRAEGLSQAEIAEKLGTSRSNICSLEKRARRNVDRAERTIRLAEKIRAPVKITIDVDGDILDSIKRLFSEADEADIHVKMNTPGLISKIERGAGEKLEGRKATEKIELSLTPEGDVNVS